MFLEMIQFFANSYHHVSLFAVTLGNRKYPVFSLVRKSENCMEADFTVTRSFSECLAQIVDLQFNVILDRKVLVMNLSCLHNCLSLFFVG
jgi:hypothetical protein